MEYSKEFSMTLKHYAREMFKSKVCTSDGQAFEDLFIKVMQLANPNFRPVKPQGRIGDKKNDGFDKETGTYYQVYAPENLSINIAKAISKLEDGFKGLYDYWQKISPIKHYYFVINDKYKGAYPDIEKSLADLEKEYTSVKCKPFLAKDLQTEFLKLKIEEIQEIIGLVPEYFRCKFLERIGYQGNKWYGKINDLYVPPFEYEDIKKTLEKKRIVFITGPPEYGKTYTAVKLMREYNEKDGYEPIWIKGGSQTERNDVSARLENIFPELKSGHIIYFEDPFGRDQYLKKEGLEREIGTIIKSIEQHDDVYVIITSRNEVFKEFKKEKSSEIKLEEFEHRLNIESPSYNYEKRKEILIKLSEVERCKWLNNDELKIFVIKSLENLKILPTILSMKEFAKDSIDLENITDLEKKLTEKSKEVARAFSKEIIELPKDKILFLSFPFIANKFEIDFIKKTYRELIDELRIDNASSFEIILNWFKDDKIYIYLKNSAFSSAFSLAFGGPNSVKSLEFSHDSYYKAFQNILMENGNITSINEKILSKLLLKLSEKDKVADIVAECVETNFERLSVNVREKILLNLVEKEKAIWDTARIVGCNYYEISEDVRNQLLDKILYMNDSVKSYLAFFITPHFGLLPEHIRIGLFGS